MATAYDTKRKGQDENQDTINRLIQKAKEGGYNFSPLRGEGIHVQTRAEKRIAPMIGTNFIPPREELRWLRYFITGDWKWTHHVRTWINKASMTGRVIGALRARYL